MSFLHGITDLKGLGALSPEIRKKITESKSTIEQVLKQANHFSGLGLLTRTAKKTLSFEDVVQQYNKGISDSEIKAWVWYKRSMGVPMRGWEKWYISGTDVTEQVVTTSDTIIKDNHFRDIRSVTRNTVLGKYIKTHNYSETLKYYIYRSESGLQYVSANDTKIQKSGFTTSQKALQELISKGALFYLDSEVVPYPVYAYGNMYERELQLEKDKQAILEHFGVDVYDNHSKIVRESRPEQLTITSPDPKQRPIVTAISDFAQEVTVFSIDQVREEFMDVEKAEELKYVNGKTERKTNKEKIHLNFDGELKYALQDVFIKWLFTLNADNDFKKSGAVEIADYYLLNKPLRNDDLTPDQKSELKANARNEGEELFARFLNEVLTFKDQQRLDYTWNRIYNGQSDIAHKRIPVGFECSAMFKSGILQITDIQREGIAFMEAVGSGICAFDVGVGKTMTAIVNLANAISSGKCKRPIVVVPKPTYKKWIGEIIGYTDRRTNEFVPGVLSYTGVTINDWSNLGVDVIKSLNLTKAVPEKSITLLTYEGFKKIGFSERVMDEMLDELINILGQSNEKTARDKELDYQKFREMIGTGNKGSVADIDSLGFDYIVIDEAHRCKNVFAGVKADEERGKRYNITGAVSETGQKAFFLCNFIQRRYGRNIMLLTATPFTNSPVEIYSMLSLVAHESMSKAGILNIDTFFDLFVIPTLEFAANYKEEIVEKEVVKSFTNRLVLQRLIHNHILYKTGEEAGVKRPCKVNLPRVNETHDGRIMRLSPAKQILTYLKMTERQRINQNAIVALAKNATQGKLDMGNLFRAIAYSLDNALSPFLYKDTPEDHIDFVENSPKIRYVIECIATVKKWHEERGETCSGQVIYMNRGKKFFPMIKQYMEEKHGFKKGVLYDKTKVDEIEVISSEINDTRKELIKEAFLEGIVKVIIGTATIREGIDLQKKGTVIYNCYPEWNPTDIRQLEGRIWRQGNLFGYVRIVMPLVQDSMDVFVFQKLEEKTGRINDIWFKGNRGNVLDLESLDPNEVKLALITDVDRLVKMFFDQEKETVEKELRRADASIKIIRDIDYDIRQYNEYRGKSLSLISDFYSRLLRSSFLKEIPEDNLSKSDKEKIKKVKDLKEAIELVQQSPMQDDKDILAILRRIENSQGDLQIWLNNTYIINYYKEYVSTVKKAERNILKPKGFSISDDLKKVLEAYNNDKLAIEQKKKLFEGGENSERWESLREEIKAKKSTLAVDGKNATERAEDFAKLNYLLSFRASDVKADACSLPDPNQAMEVEPKSAAPAFDFELEALALEIELELLDFSVSGL